MLPVVIPKQVRGLLCCSCYLNLILIVVLALTRVAFSIHDIMCSSLHSLQLLFNVENANARVYLYVELYIALFARELAFECCGRRRLLLSADLSDSNVHGVKDLYNVNALFKNGTTVSRVGDSPSSGVCDSSDDLVRSFVSCRVASCLKTKQKDLNSCMATFSMYWRSRKRCQERRW